MSSFDGYHRKHLPWLAKARAVGEVWQGPSGRWFTRRNDGKVVPAEDPHAGDPGETDGRPKDSPHALYHTDSRDTQPKDRHRSTEQTVSAAEQANADTVREMILLAKKQGVTLDHVQAISGVMLRLTTRSIQTLLDTATPGNEEMVNRIKQKLTGGKGQQPQNGVAPPQPQQPQQQQPPMGKALTGYGPDARKVIDHLVQAEMPEIGATDEEVAYNERAARAIPAAMTGEPPVQNPDPLPRRSKAIPQQPHARPDNEVFFDATLDATVQTAAASGDPTGHTAQPMQRRILAFVGFLKQRFSPEGGQPGEKGAKAVDRRHEPGEQAERNYEEASRIRERADDHNRFVENSERTRAAVDKARANEIHMRDRFRESQRPPVQGKAVSEKQLQADRDKEEMKPLEGGARLLRVAAGMEPPMEGYSSYSSDEPVGEYTTLSGGELAEHSGLTKPNEPSKKKTMSAYTNTSGGALAGAKPPRKRISRIRQKYLGG